MRPPVWLRPVLTTVCFVLGGFAARAQDAPAYNVLLVFLDTVRADHLHCYGYARETSPHMDKLAGEGALFENVTAASSWTVPSHISMFTSLYPTRHGVHGARQTIGKDVPTLAGERRRFRDRFLGWSESRNTREAPASKRPKRSKRLAGSLIALTSSAFQSL